MSAQRKGRIRIVAPGRRSVPLQSHSRTSTEDQTSVLRILPSGTVRAHREGQCRPGTGCAVHDWLVTAPQQQPHSVSVDRVPWGMYHFKQNGAIVTACGEFAVSWHVFWGHDVNPVARDACRACIRAMRGRLIDGPCNASPSGR
jgi:hypothetical protein